MSSTNRGAERAPNDFYATPAWAVRSLLAHLDLSRPGRILEPAAGDGAILRELMAAGVPRDRLVAVEIREEGAAACRSLGVPTLDGDFLAMPSERWSANGVGMVITNPPFSLAMEFCQRALDAVHIYGTVAMLVRLGFLAGQRRAAWHRAHPADVYVLPKRPSFTSNGQTDSADYCWMVWTKGSTSPGLIRVLDPDAAPTPRIAAAPLDTFRCRDCGRDVPVEDGQADDAPDLCSTCWEAADPERAAAVDAVLRRLGTMARERRAS